MAKKDLSKLKEEAEKLFRKGKFDKALEDYRKLEKFSKGDVRYSQKTAEVLAKMDKKKEAVDKYQECIDKYLEKGFLVQAIAIAKVILEIDPNNPDAKRRLEELVEKRTSGGSRFVKEEEEEQEPIKEKPKTGITQESEEEPSMLEVEPEPLEEEPEPLEVPDDEAAEEPVHAGFDQDYGTVDLSAEMDSSMTPEEALSQLEGEDETQMEGDEPEPLAEGPPEIPLFSDLNPDEFSRVFDILRSVNIPPGIAICREGDEGDSIFVVAEGRVKVTRKGPDGKEIHLADLGPGDFFGEFGYFSNSIRQATVKADTKTQILEISREDMDGIVEEFPHVKEIMLKFYKERVMDNMLALSPLFQKIGQKERLKLIERFELREAEPGEVIVKEGDMGDSMFLIKSGRVEVTTINPIDKSRTILARLESGEFFGEVSLIKQKPRTASVTALTPVELMEIMRDSFEEIAAEHPEMKQVLEETIEKRVEETIEKVTSKLKTAV